MSTMEGKGAFSFLLCVWTCLSELIKFRDLLKVYIGVKGFFFNNSLKETHSLSLTVSTPSCGL